MERRSRVLRYPLAGARIPGRPEPPRARGEYDEGQRVGPWTYHHENGAVMARGAYDHDRPIGLWTVFAEDGTLVSETDHDVSGK